MSEFLEQHSGTAWACRTGEHKKRVFPGWLQYLLAATCLLEENVLPLLLLDLLYWLSLRGKRFKCFAYIGQQLVFFHVKWNFDGIGDNLLPSKAAPSAPLNIRSFIGLWVKIWLRNKTAFSEYYPVQSSRSELTTCPREGRLLRFELNSTVTSDGGEQKLWNNLWHDSESIATKVCGKISRKWNVMSESNVQTNIDRTSFNFESHVETIIDRTHFNFSSNRTILQIFWAIYLCKQSSTV